MTEAELIETLTAAAEAGRLTLDMVEDGAEFATIADWLDVAAVCDMEAAAEKIGIDLEAGDIREINRRHAAERARAAGIKGA